jgi:hypothetical protein
VPDGSDIVVFVRTGGGQLWTLRFVDGVSTGWEALPGVEVAATRGAVKA